MKKETMKSKSKVNAKSITVTKTASKANPKAGAGKMPSTKMKMGGSKKGC